MLYALLVGLLWSVEPSLAAGEPGFLALWSDEMALAIAGTDFAMSRKLDAAAPRGETSALTPLIEMRIGCWDAPLAPDEQASALSAVESGGVLFLPDLAFALAPDELRFLSSRWSDGKAKNIQFDRAAGRIGGALGTEGELAGLGRMIGRFADRARSLVTTLFPSYERSLVVTRTSFRTLAAEHRETSWRKDDRLLHVDAFPSRPTRGARILRVFSNVNPHGEPRVWRLGEPFVDLAARFLPGIPPPLPGAAHLLAALGITKGTRSRYDHIMLQLHDRMKADAGYQRDAPQSVATFPSGSTWVCFSDQVVHAASGGQYLLEQTLQVPVSAMSDPHRAPLRVLERLARRELA